VDSNFELRVQTRKIPGQVGIRGDLKNEPRRERIGYYSGKMRAGMAFITMT
jgi:hypothetical protein